MDTDTHDVAHQNGYAPIDITPEPVRVRFGPRKSQTMPLDWAEHILTELAKDPQKFGKFLTNAALEAK